MQLQQLLEPLKHGTALLTKSFFTENPVAMKKYVDTSITAISYVLVPLNVFMKHLLLVQGLDPDTVPGVKASKALQAAMDKAFEPQTKAYDDDYDFSWVQKRFEETRNHMRDLNLTKEKYMDLTNLSNIPIDPRPPMIVIKTNQEDDKPQAEVNSVAPVSPKREIRLTDPLTSEGRKALREKILQDAKEFNDPINSLKTALDSIEKELGLDQKKGIKSSKKKANKGKAASKAPKKIVKVGDHYAQVGGPRTSGVIARLVDEMVSKGLCEESPEAKAAQVQEMDKWTDSSLESIKRILERHVKPYAEAKEVETKFGGTFRRSPQKGK